MSRDSSLPPVPIPHQLPGWDPSDSEKTFKNTVVQGRTKPPIYEVSDSEDEAEVEEMSTMDPKGQGIPRLGISKEKASMGTMAQGTNNKAFRKID